jgi:hypothetical protein
VVLVVGETVIELPVPTKVPPQLPLYHCHAAPVPKEPPFTESVVELPLQIGDALTLTEPGAVESVFTVTVTDAHEVVLHVPMALTKYVVLLPGETVTEFPVPTNVPPQLPLYQFHAAPVPKLPPLTVSVVELPLQMVVVPLMPVGVVESV